MEPTAAAAERVSSLRDGAWVDRVPSVALALVIVAAVVLTEAEACTRLAVRWLTQDGYTHGPLVAALVPLLVWSRRAELAADPGGRFSAAALLSACVVALALLRAAHLDLPRWALLPALALAAIWLALGRRAAWTLAFPIGSFLYAVPVWEALTPPLQRLTVVASGGMAALLGVRAHIDGTFVVIASGTFEIAGGCSGTSYFVIMLAASTTIAFLERLPRRRAALLVLAALAAALVANWIRVAAIVYIGDATAMRSPLVADHERLGWWVFAVALVPVVLLSRHISTHLPPAPRTPAAVARGAVDPAGVVLALALLAVAPVWALALDRAAAAADGVAFASAPELRPLPPTHEWSPVFPGATAERLAARTVDGAVVDTYVAAYLRQGPGHKLVGEGARLGGDRWIVSSTRRASVAGPGGAGVNEVELRDPSGRRRIVWFWYEVRGARVLRPGIVKLRESLSAFGLPSRSGIVAISAACRPDCDAARAALAAGYADGLGRLAAGTAGRAERSTATPVNTR